MCLKSVKVNQSSHKEKKTAQMVTEIYYRAVHEAEQTLH